MAIVEPGHAAYVLPHHIAEGKGEGSDLPDGGTPLSSSASPASPSAAASPSASASAAEPAAPKPAALMAGSQPDPEPLKLAEQWQYQIVFENGAARVEGVQKRTLPKPVPTPRRMGRFALELWIGHELVDRVRFDFPLLASEETPGVKRRPLRDSPSLSSNALSRVRIDVPASPRATRLMLIDRATEKVQALEFPPAEKPMPLPVPAAMPTPDAQSPTSNKP